MTKDLEIIILAAGLGTRMKSELPKVLHRVCDTPMIELLLEQLDLAMASEAARSRFNIVVGHGRQPVIEAVEKMRSSGRLKSKVVFTVQEQQNGTGHAVKLALEKKGESKTVAVFNGDLPLFTSGDFECFLAGHERTKSVASLASTCLEDPQQYGRILRKSGKFVGTVEHKDATAAQKKIAEINGGVYLFDRKLLEQALSKIGNKNASGEFYLPDVFNYAKKQKKTIQAFCFEDPVSLTGVNNMHELALAQKLLYSRVARKLMAEGVFLHEPEHTYIGPQVKIGRRCVIGPFTSISGRSQIGDEVRIGAHCDLKDVSIGNKSLIRNSTVAESSEIGEDCAVGPMAHLRPGTKLKNKVRVGNFVEIKESSLGEHTNAAHLSYVGDAEIGSNVNLGCGFITCNFDGTIREGRRKHRSRIGNDVFVGSDSQVIAPIEIADGTFIASGSTVSESVKEKDSLVIARTRQVTKPGYAKKYRG